MVDPELGPRPLSTACAEVRDAVRHPRAGARGAVGAVRGAYVRTAADFPRVRAEVGPMCWESAPMGPGFVRVGPEVPPVGPMSARVGADPMPIHAIVIPEEGGHRPSGPTPGIPRSLPWPNILIGEPF